MVANMSRRSRGSFFLNSSNPGGDEHTQACVKELLRHYDSTVVYSGIYEDGDSIHASALGVSGILVHRPVVNMDSGDRIKGTVGLSVSSLLHEFCKGKIFLIKLLLPHHPAAKDELGPKYDQVSPTAYAKTAEFLLDHLKNVNMKDSQGKTSLERLMARLADQVTCATNWLPVLEFLLSSGAQLNSSEEETSAVTLLQFLAENRFRKKSCSDGCEKAIVSFFATRAEKEAIDADSLGDIFEKKNAYLAGILENIK